MIGILIIAHDSLGKCLIESATHILGNRPPQLDYFAIDKSDDPSQVILAVQKKIQALDQGEGVLILSDIYGATPCNIVCRVLSPGKIEGISGINLPMLVRAVTYRHLDLKMLTEKAMSGGLEGVINITKDVCNGPDLES
jgi:mannose PTS system EIIA component